MRRQAARTRAWPCSRLCAGAAQGTDGLPKLYHGLVRRDLLEELKRRSGQYVHGSSPDMSAAVALSLVCPEFVSINYPLTVPGGSGGSNTGRSAMNQHRGRMGEDSQTKAFVNQGWSLGVPRYFAVETVWAHAALDTLRSWLQRCWVNSISPD
jgi:hypothetical protein